MLRISVLITILLAAISASAADRYWIGASGALNNWNNTANWSTTSGGTGGASVPTSTDIAIFDGNGLGNCTINATVNIAGINVQSGYTGTISQGSNTITIGASNAVFSGGTFTGGSANITVNGTFTLSGTAFTSTTGVLQIAGAYTFSSGTFTHNNGEVRYTTTATLRGNTTFYTLNFAPASPGATYTIGGSTTFTVNNLFTTSGGYLARIDSGIVDVKGDIDINNFYANGYGSATVKITGTGNQNFTGQTTGWAYGILCNVIIDKSSGTLTLKDNICVGGNWTYLQGAIDDSTYSNTVSFVSGKTISGTHTLRNVAFTANGALYTITIASGTTFTVSGTLTYASTYGPTLNTGVLNLTGDIVLANSSSNGGGGSATININGPGAQSIVGNSTALVSKLPNVVINKPSGTLSLSNTITVSGNWTYTNGTINPGTSTVYFYGTKTITGSYTLSNVSFEATTATIAAGTTLTVNGTLAITGSLGQVVLNTGTIEAKGNITLNNTSSAGGGDALIKINGTGDQTINGYGGSTSALARMPNVEINKASGTLYLTNTMAVAGNWTYTAGTVNYGTSTVIFVTTKTITGSINLYNVLFNGASNYTYTIASGTTLTVEGELTYSSIGNIVLNTGTVVAKGNLSLVNTGTGGGGSALIKIAGTGDQTLTGFSGTLFRCKLPNVEINKASGTLFLQNSMTVVGNWTYVSGNIDAGSSTVIFITSKTITGSHTLANVIFSGAAIYTYTIGSGATLTVKDFETNGTSAITFNGGTLNINGNITINNSATTGGGTTNINITGTGNQLFTGNGVANKGRLPGININKPSGTLTLSSLISIAGNWTYTAGTVDASTNASTVAMCATSTVDAQGTSANMAFHHLIINTGAVTIGGALNLAGNLTINNSTTLTNTTYPVYIGGNWTNNNAAANTYTPGTSTIIFNGTETQTISKPTATESFYGLAIDKAAGNVSLSSPVTVTNALTLNSGKITTTSTNLLTLNNGATSSDGSDASFVSGPMKKIGNAAFTFPLGGTSGGASYYHPLSITAPTTSTDAFTAEYIASGYSNDSILVDSLKDINHCQYWTLQRTAGTSNVYAKLGWNTNCQPDNYADLSIAAWNGSTWSDLGNGGVNVVNTATGTVVSSIVVPFTGPAVPMTFGNKKTNTPYAVLRRKLDGGYYTAYNGKLLFKYDEEYNDANGLLTFNIYDKAQNIIGANSFLPIGQQKAVALGDNRYMINLINCYINMGNGFFVLEVINEKNEKWYLRFKHQTSISVACPPSGNNPQ